MRMLINDATVIEAVLLSFLLALWISRLGLRGFFRLMPATSRSAAPVHNQARVMNMK